MSSPPSTVLCRSLYVRALAAVHLVAIGSLWPQLHGLVGSRGILPFAPLMEYVAEHYGSAAPRVFPTLLWLWPTDAGLHALCGVGMGAAALLLVGIPFEGPLLLCLWAIYLSLSTVGQVFLGFQWDGLLVEATFAALLVARWRPGQPEPPRWAWWVQWWVVFRLMFFGGLVKLTSGDPTWSGGTALTYHYWTQPLPNPVSWYADRLPVLVHQLSVWAMFAIELLLPFAIVFRWGRLVAFAGFALLLGLLALTGNFGYFQLLSLVCCLSLLDDGFLGRIVPKRFVPVADRKGAQVGLPVALALVVLSSGQLRRVGVELPEAWTRVLAWPAPFRTANAYGLFAVMTTERPEVVLEGSRDGVTWTAYELPFKPGDPGRMPGQAAPHMPRLDWQLWFAALGTCDRNPWVVATMQRLVEGSEPVVGLFAGDPFGDEPPRWVRAVRYRYRFAPPRSDVWWVREEWGPYCPAVER